MLDDEGLGLRFLDRSNIATRGVEGLACGAVGHASLGPALARDGDPIGWHLNAGSGGGFRPREVSRVEPCCMPFGHAQILSSPRSISKPESAVRCKVSVYDGEWPYAPPSSSSLARGRLGGSSVGSASSHTAATG